MGSSRLWILLAIATAMVSVGVSGAGASTASEEQQGAALVKAFNAGDRSCASVSADDFERIGEYAMGLNFATVAQHGAMNAHMRAMMGARGEELAHQAMGRAYAGCVTASQRDSGSYGGMMSGYSGGMMNGTPYGPGMMSRSGARNSAGSARLTGAASGGGGHHDWSTGAVIGVAVLVAALAGGLVALLVARRHRPAAGAS